MTRAWHLSAVLTPGRSSRTRQIKALFDGNDLDKDGKITVEEAVAYNVTTFEQLSDADFQKHMLSLAALAKKAAAEE